MVFAYSYLKAELFLLVIPLMAFFISYFVLVISTLQMFYKHRKQKDAKSLTSLLQSQFDTDIDIQSTESQYSWNSLTPYFVFFGTLPVMVLSFSFANRAYIPCAEVMVVGVAMTAVCFFGLSDSHDMLTLAALAAHAFSSLPLLLGTAQATFFLKAVGFITKPFLSLHLGFGVWFNLSLPSAVHMLIPFLFLRMAMRGPWSGVLKTVIPHLVCYCWFSFVIAVFPFTTWSSLARATIGYLLLPIFVPASLLAFVFGFFYIFYKLLQTELIGKLIVTLLLIAVPILLTQTKTLFGKKSKTESPRAKKFKRIFMVVFSIAAVLPLLFVRVPSVLSKKKLSLSQEDYQDLCVAGENELVAPYQIRCHDFIGTQVNWTGQVSQVKVLKVENTIESVFKSLPSVVAQPLYCIYGDPLPDCDEGSMSKKSYKYCQLMSSSGQTCHLHSHDQVSFTLMLSVGDGNLTVSAEASSSFRAYLLALEPGDKVQFLGKLLDAGTASLTIKLKSVKCISRQLPVMEALINQDTVDEETLFKMAVESVALSFNFGLFPVFTFTPGT
ncbi:wolframin-like [Plakobranchus ocellatus]|uniref:Wolframin-like n=1 Tax=Plakobranchus ocellatus TaxID=259542 RepID=A0AAV4E241_9GAST|nr:wolframin-like [Plakobranchus ocellatus]